MYLGGEPLPKITVVGSINIDFMIATDRMPKKGETVEGKNFSTNFGGKGANQAVTAAKLGAEVHMIGAVGEDEFGQRLIDNLKNYNINTDHVKIETGEPSGASFIRLYQGDNSIIYVPGANNSVSPQDIVEAESTLTNSDMVIVQNESPKVTVEYLIDFCDKKDIPILLNPAPARTISKEYIEQLDFFTPNETEFSFIFGEQKVEDVLTMYPNKLIMTIGSEGAIFHNGEKIIYIPALEVDEIVDTTGAGDTFNGAFAYAYQSNLSIKEAVSFANLTSSVSIQKFGAQTGAPDFKEIQAQKGYQKYWEFEN